MNEFNGIGRLTRDTELRYSKAAEPIAILRNNLAIPREFKKNESDFINILAFGKKAEVINQYCRKGGRIGITGHIQTGKYDNNGTTVYTTEVIVDKITFIESKSDNQNGGQAQQQPEGGFFPIDDNMDDDLPF